MIIISIQNDNTHSHKQTTHHQSNCTPKQCSSITSSGTQCSRKPVQNGMCTQHFKMVKDQPPLPQTPTSPFDIITGPAILYYGAGWDARPLSMKEFKGLDYFIFVDALPKLPHYTPGQMGYPKSKDEESFVKAITDAVTKKKFKLISHPKNILHFSNGTRHLIYWYNTTVEDSLKDAEFLRAVKNVIWIHNEGFNPFENGLTIEKIDEIMSPNQATMFCQVWEKFPPR